MKRNLFAAETAPLATVIDMKAKTIWRQAGPLSKNAESPSKSGENNG
jgi:hypothetical protein